MIGLKPGAQLSTAFDFNAFEFFQICYPLTKLSSLGAFMRLLLVRFDVDMIEVGSYTSHRMEDVYACRLAMLLFVSVPRSRPPVRQGFT